MKSQKKSKVRSRNQNNTQRKNKSRNQNNNQNNNNNTQGRKSQNKNTQRQGKNVQRQGKNNQNMNNQNNNSGVKRLVKLNKNQQKSKYARKKKRTRRRNQKRRNQKKSKKQRGGYSGLDYSILPCSTRDGVSVANFDAEVDASSKICSDNLDMLRDSETGVADGVSVLSGLSDFVRGGTTQVINERTALGGDGETRSEQRSAMDNVVAESRYRALDSLDGQGGRQTRSASENDEYATLGEGEAARWQRLSALGFTGASGSFRERLPYSG